MFNAMIFRLLPSSCQYFCIDFHSFHSCLCFSVLQSSNILKYCFNNFGNGKICDNLRCTLEVGKSNVSFVKCVCLSVRPSIGLVKSNKTSGPLQEDLNTFIIFLWRNSLRWASRTSSLSRLLYHTETHNNR